MPYVSIRRILLVHTPSYVFFPVLLCRRGQLQIVRGILGRIRRKHNPCKYMTKVEDRYGNYTTLMLLQIKHTIFFLFWPHIFHQINRILSHSAYSQYYSAQNNTSLTEGKVMSPYPSGLHIFFILQLQKG